MVRNSAFQPSRWAKKLNVKPQTTPVMLDTITSPQHDAQSGRTMVLVDIENFCQMPNPSVEAIEKAQTLLETLIRIKAGDQMIIACDVNNIANVGFTWRGNFELRMGQGKDGADLELLEELENGQLADRFENVIVVSGDHIYAPSLRILEAQGVNTRVISHSANISAELYISCKNTQIVYA
ncbi:MAG: NYN domain-containing protein [Microbacteriaceae bacterium]